MAVARAVCSVSNCSGTCYQGCTSCEGTCSTGCTSCSGTCSGSCSNVCTSCVGTCHSGCSGCSGSCSGGCSGCSGGCSGTCSGSCTNGCTTTCTQTCNNFCNAGCEESAMAFTVAEFMEADNMQDLADLVFFELARRPSASMESVNGLFVQNNKIYLGDFTQLTSALTDIGQILSYTEEYKAMKSFVNEIVNKLLAANAETVPID